MLICLACLSCKEIAKKKEVTATLAGVTKTVQAEQHITDLQESTITQAEFMKAYSAYHNPFTMDSARFSSIDGKTSLPLKSGVRVFTNNNGVPYDENIETYVYRGQFESIKSYLVEVNLYEDNFFLLINKNTGKTDTLSGFPYLSEDHRQIFCSQYNPYETYDDMPPPTQDAEFYTVSKTLIKQVNRKPFKFFIDKVCWKDNNTIYLKTSSDQGTTDFTYRKLSLSR